VSWKSTQLHQTYPWIEQVSWLARTCRHCGLKGTLRHVAVVMCMLGPTPQRPSQVRSPGLVHAPYFSIRPELCIVLSFWPGLVSQDPQKRHRLDRKLVTEVVCALCDTRQPVAQECSSCGVSFGRYSCMQCNFFDDDTTKQQFHCSDCGICRVGGRANFFHCGTCNCCYSTSLRDSHVCVTNSMHQNCPVCFEYLFDSIRPISVLPCGHTIHQVRPRVAGQPVVQPRPAPGQLPICCHYKSSIHVENTIAAATRRL